MEVRKIGEVVGDIALEGISELKDIVWGVFEEGIELVLVVDLNLAFSLVLPKSCSAHLSTRRMQDCQLKIETLSSLY